MALIVSPTAYPLPPKLTATLVTAPPVTVISASAPVPDPVTLVNGTSL